MKKIHQALKTPFLKKQVPESHSDRGCKIIQGKYSCTLGPFFSLHTVFLLTLRGGNSCLIKTAEVLFFGQWGKKGGHGAAE